MFDMTKLLNPNWSLRKQLLVAFGIASAVPLILILISCNIFLALQSKSVTDKTTSSLTDQAYSDMFVIQNSVGGSFDKYMTLSGFSTAGIMQALAQDSFRSDYPYYIQPSYYDLNCTNTSQPFDCVAQPLQFSKQAGGDVFSFSHSAINLYQHYVEDLPSIPSDVNETIWRTATMDLHTPFMYGLQNDFASFFVGIDDLFRRYPGAPRNTTDAFNFDPRQRPWFRVAQNNMAHLSFSSPFTNFFTGDLQVSMSLAFTNGYTADQKGVVSGTFLVGVLGSRLDRVQYLNGVTILFEKSSGLVVAKGAAAVAPSFPPTSSSGTYFYHELVYPPISADDWNTIKSSDSVFSSDRFVIRSFTLPLDTSKRFVMVTFVEKSVIDSAVQPVKDSMTTDVSKYTTAVNLACAGILVICVLLVLFITSRLATPLEQLTEASKQVTANIGGDKLMDGVQLDELGMFQLDETKRLKANFVKMMQTMEDTRRAQTQKAVIENPMYVRPTYAQLQTDEHRAPHMPEITINNSPEVSIERAPSYHDSPNTTPADAPPPYNPNV